VLENTPSWRNPLEGRSLSIRYPCPWDYQIIGEDEDAIRSVVGETLGAAEYVLTLANRSRKGRYVSLHLTVRVRDESQRTGIFEALRSDVRVRYVL
jgi:hypothetical protein